MSKSNGLSDRLVAFRTAGGKLADPSPPPATCADKRDAVFHGLRSAEKQFFKQFQNHKNRHHCSQPIEALPQRDVTVNDNVQIHFVSFCS